MNGKSVTDPIGKFDARYVAFIEAIAQLRPRLHRYCSRMTGSIMDGEDVVQDALFEAYRKLDQYDDNRPLAPWLFPIPPNRCLTFRRTPLVPLEPCKRRWSNPCWRSLWRPHRRSAVLREL